MIQKEKCCNKPYAEYKVVCAVGGVSGGSLETEHDYEAFVSEIVSLLNQENNLETVTVSRLVNGNVEVEELAWRIDEI